MSEMVKGGALGWDAEINSDGVDFVLLENGDYEFEVVNMERGSFPGSEKMSPCPKATLTLKIMSDQGTAMVKDDLILNELVAWKLGSFFRSIGLKKHGEAYRMDWGRVKGSRGRVRIIRRQYIGSDGKERTVNAVDRYLDPVSVSPAPAATAVTPVENGKDWLQADEELPFE